MDCVQCDTLTRTFEDIERIYAEARGCLSEVAQWSDINALGKARVWVNQVRVEYEVARVELERHQEIHTLSSAGSNRS